jgi:hypothetical protein
MPTREEHLAKYTYKGQGLDLEQRVFYTLSGEEDEPSRDKLRIHRNTKAIALLFRTLHETGTLTENQLDEILLKVVA